MQELTRLRILDIKGIDPETTPTTPSVKIEKSSKVKGENPPATPEKVELATPVLAWEWSIA